MQAAKIESPSEGMHTMDDVQGAIEKAEALCREGKLVEAIQLGQNTLPVVQKLFGPKSPELAKQLRFLGLLYLAKADEFQKDETIRIATATVHIEKLEKGRWVELFLGRMARAGVLEESEKEITLRADEYLAPAFWAKATEVFESALCIQRSLHGPTHPALVETMLTLAALYDYFVLEEEARQLKDEAEGIKRRIAASLEASGLGGNLWIERPPYNMRWGGTNNSMGESNPGIVEEETRDVRTDPELREYCEIIREVTEKLTGHSEWDIAFLNEQAERYREHRWGEEISRAIGRLVFSLLPEEKQKEVGGFIERHNVSEESILHEARIKLEQGRLKESEQLVKSLLPDQEVLVEDKASVYLASREPFERVIYDYHFKPGKRIRGNPNVHMQAFFFYAYLLVEKKDFDAALEVLNRGLRYNPVDVHFLFEAGEIHKMKKDWAKFRDLTDRCYDFSFKPADVAHVFRNYGYMFIEQGDLEAAICCYAVSRFFCDHEKAQSELFYISERLKKRIDLEEYFQKGEKILSKYGISFGASREVLGLSYSMGNQCEEEGDLEGAIYFFNIFAELARDDEVLKRIDDLQRALSVRDRGLH